MKIALSQINIIFDDVSTNLSTVEEFVKQASINECQLIIFPEMTCTGFTMNPDMLLESRCIEEFMQNLSKQYHIKICYGLARQQECAYNHLSIIDGNKELLGYDKIHLFQRENKHYHPGKSLSTCQIDDLTIGACICFDLRFPDIFQELSRTSDVMIVIASWPDIRDDHWLALLKARAIETQRYVIGVNRIGSDPYCHYIGHSVIFDSYGRCLGLLEDENNLYIDIQKEDIKKALGGFYTR